MKTQVRPGFGFTVTVTVQGAQLCPTAEHDQARVGPQSHKATEVY